VRNKTEVNFPCDTSLQQYINSFSFFLVYHAELPSRADELDSESILSRADAAGLTWLLWFPWFAFAVLAPTLAAELEDSRAGAEGVAFALRMLDNGMTP